MMFSTSDSYRQFPVARCKVCGCHHQPDEADGRLWLTGRPWRIVATICLALIVAMTACGTSASRADVDSSTTVAAPRSPGGPLAEHTVTDVYGNEVTIKSTERIIPVDGDIAEIVFALGAGDQVVATDLSATFPPEADALPQIGYQRSLTAEPIIELQPTLVIGTKTAGPPETLDALRKVGIPVVIVDNPSAPGGPGIKIRAIGEALGLPGVAEKLASETDALIAEHSVPKDRLGTGPRVAALYLRGDKVSNMLGKGIAIDWMIEAVGAINIADEFGVEESAPITAEAMVVSAPLAILVTTSGLESVGGIEDLMKIPGIAETPAAENGFIFAYDDQRMLGNGPRTGEFLAELAADLETVTTGETQ